MNDKTKSSRPNCLAIVVPCFNETESIEYTIAQLSQELTRLINSQVIDSKSFLFFVDDGSSDDTWLKLSAISRCEDRIRGLKLSKNFGHQAAVLAGLTTVTDCCDIAISIDADLQQDIAAIKKFVASYQDGSDIVLGIRNDRATDSYFKKVSAGFFYRFSKVMGVETVPNHADYRLLSNRAMKALSLFSEPNIYLRALCLELGFKVSKVYFDVDARKFGISKYSLKKMLTLALHGITSYSIRPLRLVTFLGFLIFLFSLAMTFFALWHKIFVGDAVPGWTSTILPIYFLGGIQLFCIGIVGEYVGQIFKSVKQRPRWILEEEINPPTKRLN